jgi:hypothetical protein
MSIQQTLTGQLLRAQDRLKAAEATAAHNPCSVEREAATSRVLRARAEIAQITKAMEKRLGRSTEPPGEAA